MSYKRGAHPYRSGAHEVQPAPAQADVPSGDVDLVHVYGLVWVVCAVNVISAIVTRSFGVGSAVCLVLLFLLPWLVRRTIWSLLSRRD